MSMNGCGCASTRCTRTMFGCDRGPALRASSRPGDHGRVEAQPQPFIDMELVEGPTLGVWLADHGGRMPWQEVARDPHRLLPRHPPTMIGEPDAQRRPLDQFHVDERLRLRLDPVHPHDVRVHRVEAQPQPFIDMELVEGPNTGIWLADHGGRMPWQEAVRIARDLPRHPPTMIGGPDAQRRPLDQFHVDERLRLRLDPVHPNIVRVHRVEAQPQPFIDMELVEGPTLGVWLADHGGRMPWQEAVRIARDLLPRHPPAVIGEPDAQRAPLDQFHVDGAAAAAPRPRPWSPGSSTRRATRGPCRTRTSCGCTGVEAQPQPFIDMELVEGPNSLGVWLADHGGRMPWQEAVRIARDLASALEHAHRLGRVHRDVKPGNILMADEGRMPKLVDFGIAMIDRPEATRLTRHGEMVGTPRYMSPEQVRGEQVDARTDLYSLGAVLYEMLAGGPAVEGDSLVSVTTRIVTSAPRPLRERAPGVPAAVAAVVERLMAKDRATRYTSAAEARAALEACMGRRDRPAAGPAWPAQGDPGGEAGRGRRLRLPLAIGGVAALGVLGTLIWLFVMPPPPPISDAPITTPPIAAKPGGEFPPGMQNGEPLEFDVAAAPSPAALPEAADAGDAMVRLDEELRAMPCARLETEPMGSGPGVQVASTDPAALATADGRLGADAAAAGLRSVLLPEGAVACGVFGVINGVTAGPSLRFVRLEAPVDGACDAADRVAAIRAWRMGGWWRANGWCSWSTRPAARITCWSTTS